MRDRTGPKTGPGPALPGGPGPCRSLARTITIFGTRLRAEAWRQNLWQLTNLLLRTPYLLPPTISPFIDRISSKMVRDLPRRRRAATNTICSNPPSPQASRPPKTILDTPRHTHHSHLRRSYHLYHPHRSCGLGFLGACQQRHI
jgi:hypothetical protein